MGTKTALQNYDEKLATFYVEKVCNEADVVYRFAYVQTLSREDAFAAVISSFEAAVDKLDKLYAMPTLALRAFLLQACWKSVSGHAGKADKAGSPLQKLMQPLDTETRAVLFCVDLAGLSSTETASVLGFSQDSVSARLAKGRGQLVPHAKVSDPATFFSYLPDYLNEDLSGEKAQTFKKILESADPDLPEQFRQALGNLQLQVQGYYLAEIQNTKLQELVESKEVRETIEAQKIQDMDQWEATGNMRRRATITLAVLVAILSAVYYFSPKREAPFNALQNIVYEALAMEEDPAGGRLNLPSNDIKEVLEFFEQHQGLEFSPVVLVNVEPELRVDGASVIDYETTQVSVAQYFSPQAKDYVFVFSYKGKLKDLPKSQPGNVDGLQYQAYTSDQLNVIAWQSSLDTVSMVVGRRSAPNLASLANQR